MQTRAITPQEYAILKNLKEVGSSRRISPSMSGRLALYGLITEAPDGWTITPAGKEALSRPVIVAAETPTPERERSGRRGPRKIRISPFF